MIQAQTRDLAKGQPILVVADAFFRHKRLFTSSCCAVILLVAAMTLLAKREYQSEMKLLLENNRSNAVITADRSSAPALTEITEQQINSELELLGSEDVLNATVDPGWGATPTYERTAAAIKQHQEKLDTFRKRLKIAPARKSNVIDVSFTSLSPRDAQETLQRFSTAYLAHRKQLSRPSGTLTFFADEARRYKETWQKANQALVTFQQKNQLVSVQEAEQTLSKQIASNQDDLRTAQATLNEMNHRLAAGKRAAAAVPARQQTQQHTILSQSSVDQMRTLLVQLQNRRTELLTRYTSNDPLVSEVNREIIDTSASLEKALAQKGQEDTTDVNPAWQQVNSGLIEGGITRQALLARSESLHKSISDLQSRLSQLQALDVPFNGLQEQADQARSNFELFSEKRDQAQIENAMDERKLTNIAIVQNPTWAFHPVSPRPLLDAALGLLTALFLGAGAVYLAEYLRTTVSNARELELCSRYPVLLTVPYSLEGTRSASAEAAVETSISGIYDPISNPRMVPAMQNLGKMKGA